MTKLIPLFLLLFASSALGQWRQTSGPEGGNITNLTIVNGKLVVQINSEQLFRLDGQQWVNLPVAQPAAEFYSVRGHLINARWDGLHVSTDEGVTWNWALQANDVPRVSIDHDTLYAVNSNALFRSVDRGLNWTEVEHEPVLWTVAAREGIVVAAPIEATGLLRSTDNGKTYTAASTGLPDTVRVAQLSTDHGFFYAGTTAGIFRSSDEGLSWERFESGIAGGVPFGLKRLMRKGDFTFLETNDTVYIATLDNWKVLSEVALNGIVEDGSVIYGGRLGDVQTTFFMGDSWTKTTPPLLVNMVRNIVSTHRFIMADGATGLFRTSNDGDTWERVSDIRSIYLISQGSTVQVLGRTPQGKYSFQRTHDQGTTWRELTPPVENLAYVTGLARSTGALYLAQGAEDLMGSMDWIAGGVLLSTDRGTTWSQASNGLPTQGDIFAPIYGIYADDEVLLAATVSGLYRSTDGAESWSLAIDGLIEDTMFRPYLFTRIGGKVYAASGLEGYVSSNNGESWTKLPDPDEFFLGIGRFEGELYTIQNPDLSLKMFRLKEKNGSLEWVDISDRIPSGVTPIKVLEGGVTAYLGTRENGVWVQRQSASVKRPGEIARSVAYPNPSAQFVTIPLSEDHRGSTIAVYDMLSREVASVDVSAGKQRAMIDVRSFIPGNYTYLVHSVSGEAAGSFTVVR